MDFEISDDEKKHDLKEFKKLQKYVTEVEEELEKGTYNILEEKELERFKKAISDARNQVDKLTPYFNNLEKELKGKK